MKGHPTTLNIADLHTGWSATRVIRPLAVLALAVVVPALVVLATPLIGWVLLAAVLASPLILAYVIFAAARQAEVERGAARG
jgi:uncharacterized membrane protein